MSRVCSPPASLTNARTSTIQTQKQSRKMDAFCFYQEVLYRQARYCLDFQRAYETEQKRLADKERRRDKRRKETRERMRKLRKRRREEKLNALQSGCSPKTASEANGILGGSSKKRKVSADNPAAALITPHKPQEDVPETEHAEDNGNHYDDGENIDDNDMHYFDDDDCDDMGVEVSDRTLGASPDQSDEGKIVEGNEKVNSTKPAASTTPTAKASDGQSSEGKVGLVLIPLKGAADYIASFTTSTKYMYWPALIYSSYEAFESAFPLDQNTRQAYATVNRERMLHETHEIAKWTQHGAVPHDHPQPVQVAILFGSNVPPCGTRSYPIYPTDITIVRGSVPQMPQVALKTNGFKKISEYANNPEFQEAVQSAKKYKSNKDTKVFASLQLR